MHALPILVSLLAAQPAQNVVVIAIDGLRPSEVFTGGERVLMHGVEEEQGLVDKYWREDVDERRRALMPFFWEHVTKEGQVFGNAALGSPAKVTNALRCSYAGYNELFTGAPDSRITGNAYGPNPNVTVFEWLAQQRNIDGRVQSFATWDAFFRIFNVERSKLDVRAGWEPPFAKELERTRARDAIDTIYRTTTPMFGGNALDAITFAALTESLRTDRPRVLFVGFGENDEWMHAGRYDLALESVHRADAFIAKLWTMLQSMPEYRGTTAFIVTTDHGRGLEHDAWKHHGMTIEGSQDVFVGAFGAGIPALGERANTGLITQSQVAATITELLGFDWKNVRPDAAAPLPLGRKMNRYAAVVAP